MTKPTYAQLLEALQEMVDAHSNENIGVNASMRRIKAKERARLLIKRAMHTTGEA